MNIARFNKISVVQSLPPSDLHTGTRIGEDVETYNLAYDRGLRIELLDAITKDDFLGILKALAEKAHYDASYPVLHIEAHGSSDCQGIVLGSGEFISWAGLKPHLINLNIETKLNLLIVLSLCHGAHFTMHLNPSDRAPCWGLVGPTRALTGPALLRSFSAFYREVFASGDAEPAIDRLNESASDGDIDYYFTTATESFINVYRKYIRSYCTEKSYGERARLIRKQLKKKGISNLPSIGRVRRGLRSTERDFFEKYRRKYFMVDLFPENEKRFRVSYSDVIRGQ